MEKAVQKLLIAVNERIQLVGKRKHNMEVRGINDLGPSFIHPDFLQDCLAVWAVAVSAGVVMHFHMSAVGTLT